MIEPLADDWSVATQYQGRKLLANRPFDIEHLTVGCSILILVSLI